MVRFSKQLNASDPLLCGYTEMKGDGRVYILIHEGLRPFDCLVNLTLVHEMVHLWNDRRGISSVDDTCGRLGSSHHRKMISILKQEPSLC